MDYRTVGRFLNPYNDRKNVEKIVELLNSSVNRLEDGLVGLFLNGTLLMGKVFGRGALIGGLLGATYSSLTGENNSKDLLDKMEIGANVGVYLGMAIFAFQFGHCSIKDHISRLNKEYESKERRTE